MIVYTMEDIKTLYGMISISGDNVNQFTMMFQLGEDSMPLGDIERE